MGFIACVITNDNQENIPFSSPILLSDFLINHGFVFSQNCGGNHKCGKCKIQLIGNQSPLSTVEQKMLSESEKTNHIRLSCCAKIEGDCRIYLDQKPMHIETKSLANVGKFSLHQDGYGVAIDLGTTTVVATLIELKTNKIKETIALENPQAIFGADVLSRLDKALKGDSHVTSVIQNCLKDIFDQMMKHEGISKNQIKQVVIVGNTSMLSLLTDRDVSSIVKPPFILEENFGKNESASNWNLNILDDVPVYIPPCISGYIGADTVAAIYANEIEKTEQNCLLMDVGTNGEIVLKVDHSLYACSTAAGPAFEGVGLTSGMASKEGAISHVHILNECFSYETIGGGSPQGICGSGILDFLAIFVKMGVVNKEGILQINNHPFEECIAEKDGQLLFNVPNTNLIITQEDIRQIQMAKAAIASAIESLIKYAGTSLKNIDKVYLCGGFGTGMSIQSAQTIGMIPKGITNVFAVGNAALAGAQQLLLQSDWQCDMISFVKKVQTIDLNNQDEYMKLYVNNINF